MNNTLHIVNGDSTAAMLKQSTIEGNVVVWREMLCEGPLTKQVGSDEFWKGRYDFFESNFDVGRLHYYDQTISEFLRVDDFSGGFEIVLWFEYDLFCQVNLLALCVLLMERFRKDNRYFLICPGTSTIEKEPKLLSDYTPNDLEHLLQHKVKLTRNDLLFAEQAWEVYCSGDFDKLKSFNFNSNKKFNLLQSAIDQHLLRFPNENGLNQIELKLIELVAEKPQKLDEIIREMLLWQRRETVYGFGDMQYLWYIKNLHPYLKCEDNQLSLTLKATKLLHYGN